MFVVLTGANKLKQWEQQGKVQDYKRQSCTALNILEKRVFEIVNYLPTELNQRSEMAKYLEKEIEILLALNFILQTYGCPLLMLHFFPVVTILFTRFLCNVRWHLLLVPIRSIGNSSLTVYWHSLSGVYWHPHFTVCTAYLFHHSLSSLFSVSWYPLFNVTTMERV